VFTTSIDFTKERGWEDPGQIGYKVSSMKFYKMLRRFTRPRLGRLTTADIANTNGWQRRYDTIVVTNRVYPTLAKKLRNWVARHDGNLVLTDGALGMLKAMGIVSAEAGSSKHYAGYINFATAKKESTYKDPLARKINQPGAAEGQSGNEVRRRQTYEPVPLGYAIQNENGGDADSSPVWWIPRAEFDKAKGRQRAAGTSGNFDQISLGEIKYRGGRIRFAGALLPDPTAEFDHPFGLANYSLTYSGYQIMKNMLKWVK
jgi:hypothetical protein